MARLSVGSIVAGSLSAGPLAAVGLVVGPLGGEREHVITGVTLLAFASSWAALSGLSILATEKPQRWAIVPALTLGLGGVGLLVAAPLGPAIEMLGWIWPPVLLALSAWCFVGAQRHLHGRARRWFVYPVVGLSALCALGGAYQTVRESTERAAYEGRGEWVDLDGRRMFLTCRGAGGSTVILESGLGETSAYWGWIAPAVAKQTRVCAYDRAGRGGSDEAPAPQDGIGVATDLRALLAAASVPGPFVLVGHSSGAQYVRVFAERFPADVAGVVLLDPQPAEALTRLPTFPLFYRTARIVSALFPSLARIGFARLVADVSSDGLPAEYRDMRRVSSSSTRAARSLRDEFAMLPIALEQAGAIRSLGEVPLVVVSAARDAMAGWMPLQEEMTKLSGNSVHRVSLTATHSSLVEDEHDSTASIQAIRDVVESVRTGRPLAQP